MKKTIEELYGFEVLSLNPHGIGQTSEIYKVCSLSKSYILKSHQSKVAASNEFHCLEVLSETKISPKPIRTVQSDIYVEIKGICYTLITFIESTYNKSSVIDYFNLGKTIKTMHTTLSTLKLNKLPDRFNEQNLISEIKSAGLQSLINEKYNENYHCTYDDFTNIHGDLGIWNLLIQNNDIHIIDFGEVRYGGPYFDLAAIIESLHINNDEIHRFLNGYGVISEESIARLNNMRRKWKLRGIIYIAVNELKTEQEIYKLADNINYETDLHQ